MLEMAPIVQSTNRSTDRRTDDEWSVFQNNATTTTTTAATATAKGVAVVKDEQPNSSRIIKNSNMLQLSPPVVDLVSLGGGPVYDLRSGSNTK